MTNWRRPFLCGILFFWIVLAIATPPPPVAPRKPFERTIHGITLEDPYHWLKDVTRSHPAVLAYLRAENEYTRNYLAHTAAVRDSLYNEMVDRVRTDDTSIPVERDGWLYYSKSPADLDYPIHFRKRNTPDAIEEMILDENEVARGKDFFALSDFSVGPNHRYIAYLTDTTGNEQYRLHILDLQTGKTLPDTAFPAEGVTWAGDGVHLFYVTSNEANRSDKIFRHRLGDDISQDRLIFHETDPAFYCWISRTRSREYLVLSTGSSTTSESWILEADRPTEPFRLVAPRTQGHEYYINHQGDRFLIETNRDGARNFMVMTTPVDKPEPGNWRVWLPHRDSVTISVQPYKNATVVYERYNGLKHIRVFDHETGSDIYLDIPGEAYTIYPMRSTPYDGHLIHYSYTDMITPGTVYSCDWKTGERKIVKQDSVRGFDQKKYVTHRIHATAADGTRIPITYARSAATSDKSRPCPCYLEAYGSYGDPNDPYFSSIRLSLMDRGFIVATAHVRGGGEMGKIWYEQGKMLRKKNTFTDFITCAEHLVHEGYTTPESLVIQGGSAGGLLIGAVVNMRPDLFAVAIADVPFVDVINTMLDPSLSATVSEYEEWGNPRDPVYFEYILSYSPYDNVRPQKYPAMMIKGGFQDPRVNYWEPAKWTARLRRNNTGDNPILLSIDMHAGHGGKSGRYTYYNDIATEFAFIFDQLKIKL